jgi:hypothetical protein
MTDNTGFAAFALYNAIRLHFTSGSYDYFKYQGKTNVTKQTFATRRDKYSFYKLSRKYSVHELKEFYVSNFLIKDYQWVGEIVGPEGEENYRKWQKRIQSLTYTFESDILYLLDKYGIKGEKIFKVVDGQHPPLLVEVMSGKVSIETLIILNDAMNFIKEQWSAKIEEDILWPNWQRMIEKYSPFLQYDRNKFKKILKEKIKEYA